MRAKRARPLAVAAAVAAVTLGACSSAGPSGQAAATQARNQVLPAARALYLKFFGAGAASVPAMQGYYLPCGKTGTRRYYGADISLYPVDHQVSLDAYRQQLAGLARAGGWKLTPADAGSPLAGNGVRYQMTKGSLTGSLYVFTGSSPKVQGSTTVRSACFDAGSAAAKLPSGPESFSLPHHTPSSSASG
jgi:hypothetical protein